MSSQQIILRTKNDVTHLDMSSAMTGGTRQGKVKMIIGNSTLKRIVGQAPFSETAFSYYDDQDKRLPDALNGVFTSSPNPFINWEGFDAKLLSQSINASLPSDSDLYERWDNETLIVAKQKMAADWSISVEDIEEIDTNA